jgi:hypothetical protein
MEGRPAHLRLLQLAGVSYVVALHDVPDLELKASARVLFPQPLRLFSVPAPRPRHYAVSGVRRETVGDALRALVDPAFDPAREVVLEDVPARPPDPAFASTVRLLLRQPDHVAFLAELSADGYLVLLDGWDPGWRATVDGQPTALHRANTVFRAAAVPAGRHLVQFTYRPPSALAGAAVSLLALLSAAVLARSPRA